MYAVLLYLNQTMHYKNPTENIKHRCNAKHTIYAI